MSWPFDIWKEKGNIYYQITDSTEIGKSALVYICVLSTQLRPQTSLSLTNTAYSQRSLSSNLPFSCLIHTPGKPWWNWEEKEKPAWVHFLANMLFGCIYDTTWLRKFETLCMSRFMTLFTPSLSNWPHLICVKRLTSYVVHSCQMSFNPHFSSSPDHIEAKLIAFQTSLKRNMALNSP